MQIVLNGVPRSIDPTSTVAAILDDMKFDHIRVAVEINETLVSRKRFAETSLRDGDRIEVVTFVGGG
jgi:thiamine biosynthesis protein ThiS